MPALPKMLLGLWWVLATFSAAAPAFAEPARVALIIANAKYASLPVLANPPIDVQRIRPGLERNGFLVEVVVDADAARLADALKRFRDRAETLPADSVALIYFTGHGFKIGNRNLVAPIDAHIDEDRRAERWIAMEQVLDATAGRAGLMRIAIFDACRDNPGVEGASAIGFQPVEQVDTFVAFSAQAGTTASDGGAGFGSPFANAFERALQIPGMSPGEVMEIVAPTLSAATGGQVPAVYNNLARRADLTKRGTSVADRALELAYIAFSRGDLENGGRLAREKAM